MTQGLLHHSPAEVYQSLLVGLGLGTAVSLGGSWPVFATNEPDAPDAVITVYNTSGSLGPAVQVDGSYREDYGLQVRVRAGLDEDAHVKARAIYDTLVRQVLSETVVLDGVTYCVHSFNPSSPLLSIGSAPGSSRRIYTLNGLTYLEEIP